MCLWLLVKELPGFRLAAKQRPEFCFTIHLRPMLLESTVLLGLLAHAPALNYFSNIVIL
jgi:hypothetical protein